jgi:hypothetical protein
MTIITDSAGYSYFGDLKLGNYDIAFPSFNYSVTGQTVTGLSALVSQMLTNTGGDFSDVATDAQFNNPTAGQTLFRWTQDDDGTAHATNRRIRIYWNSGLRVALLNNDGTSLGEVVQNLNNSDWNTHTSSATFPNLPKQFLMCSSVNHFFFGTVYAQLGQYNRGEFVYAYRIPDSLINQNYNYYYNSTQSYRYVIAATNISIANFGHHAPGGVSGAYRAPYATGRANYSIACSDGQVPTSQWSADQWIFDNNATLGYPAVGKLLGALRGIGTYFGGRPVKIQGSAMPDNGHNGWLRTGSLAGGNVLFRCYSS